MGFAFFLLRCLLLHTLKAFVYQTYRELMSGCAIAVVVGLFGLGKTKV